MASYIVAHGHAHRMTAMGIVQSTPVHADGDVIAVDEKGWMQRLPQTMDMTGGDYSMVQDMLIRLTQNFQGDGTRLPSSEGPQPSLVQAEQVL